MLGEEFGVTGGGSRRWIVDPIDGTRNYSRGIPVWATLIALEEDGAIRLGVVSAPALGRRWWAERGSGAFANGDPIHVSRVAQVEDAVLCFALEQPLPAVAQRCWHPRAYGDFWAHMLVAEGAVDGAIDAIGVKLWDLAAIQPIVEEAGGRFSDSDGIARVDGLSAISSNGLLHEALLEAATSLVRCSTQATSVILLARSARRGRGRGRGRARARTAGRARPRAAARAGPARSGEPGAGTS